MTPTVLLMSCILAAPGDGPVVMAAPALEAGCHGGCGSCATGICGGASDPCPFEKKGLFARIQKLFRPRGKCVECIPAPEREKKGLRARLSKPTVYCGAATGGCGAAGCGAVGCSSCLPAIPGTVAATPAPAPAVAPEPKPTPAPAPTPAPVGEGKPAAGKVNVTIPAPVVPMPMPAPAGKPAF